MKFWAVAVLANIAFCYGCASLGDGDAPVPPTPPTDPCEIADEITRRVPADAPTIAQAVAEVGDRGRIIVAAGSHSENIQIPRNAHIVIAAADSDRPELLPADAAEPVISVAPEARVCLQGLAIRGGRSGLVVGARATEEPAGPVSLRDVHVTDAEYGVYGLSDHLSIETSAITRNKYGLVLAGSVSVAKAIISDNLIGALLSGLDYPDCAQAATIAVGTFAYIHNAVFSDNDQVGLAICSVATATIRNTSVNNNAHSGVQIRYTPDFHVDGIQVAGTRKLQSDLGDGLVVVHSSGIVENSQFLVNERANILYEGDSGGTIRNNVIMFAVFAIALEPLDGHYPNPDITDNNYMFGNQENRVAYGSSLAPSPPPAIPAL